MLAEVQVSSRHTAVRLITNIFTHYSYSEHLIFTGISQCCSCYSATNQLVSSPVPKVIFIQGNTVTIYNKKNAKLLLEEKTPTYD